MPMHIDRATLERCLRTNDFILAKAGHDLGVSTQRVYQLCKLLGIKVVKDIEYVDPMPKGQYSTPPPTPPKKGKK